MFYAFNIDFQVPFLYISIHFFYPFCLAKPKNKPKAKNPRTTTIYDSLLSCLGFFWLKAVVKKVTLSFQTKHNAAPKSVLPEHHFLFTILCLTEETLPSSWFKSYVMLNLRSDDTATCLLTADQYAAFRRRIKDYGAKYLSINKTGNLRLQGYGLQNHISHFCFWSN